MSYPQFVHLSTLANFLFLLLLSTAFPVNIPFLDSFLKNNWIKKPYWGFLHYLDLHSMFFCLLSSLSALILSLSSCSFSSLSLSFSTPRIESGMDLPFSLEIHSFILSHFYEILYLLVLLKLFPNLPQHSLTLILLPYFHTMLVVGIYKDIQTLHDDYFLFEIYNKFVTNLFVSCYHNTHQSTANISVSPSLVDTSQTGLTWVLQHLGPVLTPTHSTHSSNSFNILSCWRKIIPLKKAYSYCKVCVTQNA